MTVKQKTNEGNLADMAQMVEQDHEVQMARSDLYKIAKYAIKLHDMLKGVTEAQGIEGWQQSKITKAADYIGSVYHSLDYDMNFNESYHGKKKKKKAKKYESGAYKAHLENKLAETKSSKGK